MLSTNSKFEHELPVKELKWLYYTAMTESSKNIYVRILNFVVI